MQKLNTENLTVLLKSLDETNEDALIMKAEVYWSLGQFEESKLLLNRMGDAELV